jgi:hypothetical protein
MQSIFSHAWKIRVIGKNLTQISETFTRKASFNRNNYKPLTRGWQAEPLG